MSRKPTKGTLKGAGRVAFLARKEEFGKLLEAGHPQLAIYEQHQADLGISYSQFNRYIKQYLLNKEPRDGHQSGAAGNPSPSLPSGKPAAPGRGSATPAATENQQGRVGREFRHDPDSSKKRDDLI